MAKAKKFTMIELMIVMTVIAIVATLLLPALHALRRVKETGRQIITNKELIFNF